MEKKIILTILVFIGGIASLWFWEQSQKLPNFSKETVYYLGTNPSESGKLIAYDPQTQSKYALTKDSEVVNQYLLSQKNSQTKILYYLAVPKKYFLDSYSIQTKQSLYEIDLSTGKKRKIKFPKNETLTHLIPAEANKRIYFQSLKNLWSYHTINKTWSPLYENTPLQDVTLSETSQLILAANPEENFGYTLFSLQENTNKTPIGNYFQNFGFSPDGTQFLLKQKPNEDIFSNESFLILFSADGTSREIVKNKGEIIQAVWKDNENILVVLQDENFIKTIHQINLQDPENFIEITQGESIQEIYYEPEILWIITEEKIGEMDYEPSEDLSGLLSAFADLKTKYTLWSYDFNTDELTEWPIEGLFPRTF